MMTYSDDEDVIKTSPPILSSAIVAVVPLGVPYTRKIYLTF